MTKNRLKFLQGAGASLGVLAIAGQAGVTGATAATAAITKSPNGRVLAGVFPIGWTPCKPDSRFDPDAMVKQQQFLNRGKVAGMAWPQNASGAPAGGGGRRRGAITAAQKTEIRLALDSHLKPFLVA